MKNLGETCVKINHFIVMMVMAAFAVHASTVNEKHDAGMARHAICFHSCSATQKSLEACMLRCRNYIEDAMFRPRINGNSPDANSLTEKGDGHRYARATGAKNHMFVRVGKSSDAESDIENDDEKRSSAVQMRGSFVRIGRQMSSKSANDNQLQAENEIENDDEDDVAKRRVGFVRIGRRGSLTTPAEQFLRIGRGGAYDETDEASSEDDQSTEKRAKGQAFVRIGRKSANFVRIGRAFVRIGKRDEDASLTTETDNGTSTTTEEV